MVEKDSGDCERVEGRSETPEECGQWGYGAGQAERIRGRSSVPCPGKWR